MAKRKTSSRENITFWLIKSCQATPCLRGENWAFRRPTLHKARTCARKKWIFRGKRKIRLIREEKKLSAFPVSEEKEEDTDNLPVDICVWETSHIPLSLKLVVCLLFTKLCLFPMRRWHSMRKGHGYICHASFSMKASICARIDMISSRR